MQRPPAGRSRPGPRRHQATGAAGGSGLGGGVDRSDGGGAGVGLVVAGSGQVVVEEGAKRAILLAFKVLPMERSVVGDFRYQDRVPLKTRLDGVRVVPGAIARW